MKYFVLSDVHNHYKEMVEALTLKGFDINNQNHKVILVGDAFDRGDEPVQVFNFLKELIEKEKLIWVAGNHELFLLKRFKEGYFTSHKATYSTMQQIATNYTNIEKLSDSEVISYCRAAGLEELIKNNIVSYFETEHYVFVHGSIPTNKGKYNPDWRKVKLESWCRPAMSNGMKAVMIDGIRIPNKTIVCGHSPAAYGNVRKNVDLKDWGDKKYMKIQNNLHNLNNYQPFYGDGVIGIDSNCYKTGFVNCIVIEEDF